MIASLRGAVQSVSGDSAVIEAGGVGYEVFLCGPDLASLSEGQELFLLISESASMYGGPVLYGFLSAEGKELFELFREAVPNTGAKKALEYLGKAVRSLPEFRSAAAAKDIKLLTGMFGFTAKTAEKIVDALKHKLPAVPASESKGPEGETYSRAAGALAGLGFKSSEVRSALDEVRREGGAPTAEEMVRKALRKLSGGL